MLLLKWESKKERRLRELIEKQREDYIQYLEKQVEDWQKLAWEANGKYIGELIKQNK